MTWQDADLASYLERLGAPGIVDVHVHFMAPPVLAKVWAYFDAAGPKLGRPWPIHYRTSDEERVETLRALGVKRFTALSYAHKPGVAEFMNEWLTGFADRVPDSVRSATFFPEPEAAQYVPEVIADGVRMFKAHLQVGEFAADDPLLDPVWAAIEDAQVPVVLHAGSGPMPGPHTGPRGVANVLGRFPRLPLVIAHLGMPEVDAFCDLAEQYPNVRLDTTMTFVDFFDDAPPVEPKRLLQLQDRIVFGSDFPNIPYPYAHQVEVLDRLGLGDDWMRAVLWHNGAALLDVPA